MGGKLTSSEVSGMITDELRKVLPEITAAFLALNTDKLSPVYEKLGGKFSYEDLRLARLAKNAKIV